MNTVLLAAAAPSQPTSKSTTRQQSESAGHADDPNGFAGVLASQAATPTSSAQPGSSSSGTSVASHTDAASAGNNTSETTDKPTHHQTNKAAVDPTGKRNASGLPSSEDTRAPSRLRALPVEFQKILAALPADQASGHKTKRASPPLEQKIISPAVSASRNKSIPAQPSPSGRISVQAAAPQPSINAAVPMRRGQAQVGGIPLADPTGKQASRKVHIKPASTAQAGKLKPDWARQKTAWQSTQPRHHAPDNLASTWLRVAPATDGHSAPSVKHTDSFANLLNGHLGSLSTPPSELLASPAPKAGAVERPFASAHWATDFNQQVASLIRRAGPGNHTAELRLDPPQLGPLRITINLNDTMVQAVFTSAHASVRNAVEQALPQLQQQLEQEGLSLGQTSVGEHSQGPHSDTPSRQHFPALASASATSLVPDASHIHAEQTTTAHRPAADALIDTFV